MNAKIYADPFSGFEVLAIRTRRGMMGVAYDPRSTTLPVPWTSDCPHCQRGRQRGLSAQLRREIQFLLSEAPHLRRKRALHYVVPPASRPLSVTYWRTRQAQHVMAVRHDHRSPLGITCRPGSPLAYDGDRRSFQRPILHRCLRFLLSGRPALPAEVSACLGTLAAAQSIPRPRTRGGRRLPCGEIPWSALLGSSP
jgi:hypothetical protein